jgi:hypothetical protein
MEVTKEKFGRLAQSWNQFFHVDTLDRIKDIMEPPPPIITTPTRSPEQCNFDLAIANELLIQYTNTPQELQRQAYADAQPLLFE